MLIAAFGLAMIVWGPRAAVVAIDGWVKSSQVIENQREIDLSRSRIEALRQEVDYGHTPVGKDVEAKRRFGVGPEDEIWITVEAEPAMDLSPTPVSIADHLNRWLSDAGAEFTGRVRDVTTVVRYWVGIDEVEYGIEPAETESADDEETLALQDEIEVEYTDPVDGEG